MNVRIIDLFVGTDVIFPADVDLDREVTITENATDASPDTVLFLTRLASGERRKIDIKNSPYAIVCDREDAARFKGERLILTENVRKTLSFAYSNLYKIDYSRVKIIAVTGTKGKTTVATMLHRIFRSSGEDAGFIGTGEIRINETVISDKYYSMTTPDPHLLYRSIKEMIDFGCRYIVMEASSHGIALEKLAPIKFTVGVFTNLSHEHRDFHKTMDDYFETKLSLFEQCECGIFNLDCPYSARAGRLAKCKAHTVGIINRGDVFATDVYLRGLLGSSFFYREENLIFGVDLKLPGAFNVYNALMALKAAIASGVAACDAKRAICSLDGIDGRMEHIGDDVSVIIDYAHTPYAVENVLKTLFSTKRARQRLSVVIGCGGEREKEKRQEIGRIVAKYCDKIYLTEDNSRGEKTEDIIEEIASAIPECDGVYKIPSRKAAIEFAILHAEEGEIIAILGKGKESYIVEAGGYADYSDKTEAQLALRKRWENANKA